MVESLAQDEEYRLMAAVAEAASDYKLGRQVAEFAEMNGGLPVLEATLFERVTDLESYRLENAPDIV